MPYKIIKDIAIDISGCEFLEPYICRALDYSDDDEPMQPRAAVRIIIDDAIDRVDTSLDAYCDEHHLPLAVIRCPYIVGTGMVGLPHRIASGIYRGTYVHVRDCQARISVVHAVDVAAAVALCTGTQGTYTLTDGTDPTIHDLAEALAYRMADKRLMTIKGKWARLWYGKRYYQTLTTDHTAPSTLTVDYPDFKPVEVINYLRTHVYDESSL